MKTYIIACVILAGVLISPIALSAPADRFKGGICDGAENCRLMSVGIVDCRLMIGSRPVRGHQVIFRYISCSASDPTCPP
jgi:hypothetical protein